MNKLYAYIDDSGFSGQKLSGIINPNDYMYGAVILTEEQKKRITDEIEMINKSSNLTEFHSVDIYNNKVNNIDLSVDQRIKLFSNMVTIYNTYTPYFLAFSSNDKTLKNGGVESRPPKIEGYDLNKQKDLSLFLLLSLLVNYIRNNYKNVSFPISTYIDEGRRQALKKDSSHIFIDLNIMYSESQNEPCIQFIDFLVYCVNRIKMNFHKSKNMTDFDKTFMEVVADLKWNTNLPLLKITSEEPSEICEEIYAEATKANKDSQYYKNIKEFEFLSNNYNDIIANVINNKTKEFSRTKIDSVLKDKEECLKQLPFWEKLYEYTVDTETKRKVKHFINMMKNVINNPFV